MEDRTVVAHGCQKTEKTICSMEGENVASGRLPSHCRTIIKQFMEIFISVYLEQMKSEKRLLCSLPKICKFLVKSQV